MATISEEIAALRGTKPATFRNLLRDPSFSRLWRAILVSSLGDWVGFVAVVALVTRLGGGRAEFAVAGVMLARLLPSILFGPFAGVLVDRFDRKRLMVVADVTRGIGYASLAFMDSLAAIYVMSFAIECLSLVWAPARDAVIPNLVPRRQLVNANTVTLATGYGTLPLGGILFATLTLLSGALGGRTGYLAENPEAAALWLDALTFMFSAWMIWGVPVQKMGRGRGRGTGGFHPGQAFADMKEGVRFLKDHPFVRAMTVGIVLVFTGAGSVMALGPIFAEKTVQAGGTGWGVLVTAVGIGMILGMVLVGQMTKLIEKDRLFPLAVMAGGVAVLVLAAMPNIALAAVMTVAVGTAAGAAWVTGYTLLQENVTDELRGRVFGSLTVLSRLGLFVALAGFPVLAGVVGDHALDLGNVRIDLAGTRLALWTGAVVMLMAGIFARRGIAAGRLTRARPLRLFPRLRKVERRGSFIVFEG
ncbi:MAG: MFS transporter, partial [Actinomycetota bacterium]|nr:MFS transporter [Actinomycetota bacterium]